MCVYDDLGWDWGLRKDDAKTVGVRKMSLLREVRMRSTREFQDVIALLLRHVVSGS